jgi:hypothetical protein
MDSRRRNFGPMSERTLENAQIHLLSTRYDLSRDSLLAGEIVRYVNHALDEEEKQRGIIRVRPGELFLKTSQGDLILPIRTQEDIERAIKGERLDEIRRDIIDRCLKRYHRLVSATGATEGESAEIEKIMRALNLSRGFFKKYKIGHGINTISIRQKSYGPVNEELMGRLLSDAKSVGLSVSQKVSNMELFYSSETKGEIIDFLGREAGIPPAIREPMFLSLARVRAHFCPLSSTLRSGQMPLVSMHVKSGRRLELPTRLQPLAPVVVTIITPQELEELCQKSSFEYSELMEFHARRMARVLVEAYQQDGLISYSELQWCFLASANRIGRILGWYQHKHNVILPCPGTVLDMGRMLTHKDIIVRLYLKGMTVLEISRQTYHAPRSVDAYLKVFDSVLILHLYNLPLKLISRVLNRGESLIEEYLDLVKENLKEVGEIRIYLQSRGIKLPKETVA